MNHDLTAICWPQACLQMCAHLPVARQCSARAETAQFWSSSAHSALPQGCADGPRTASRARSKLGTQSIQAVQMSGALQMASCCRSGAMRLPRQDGQCERRSSQHAACLPVRRLYKRFLNLSCGFCRDECLQMRAVPISTGLAGMQD